MNPLTMETMFMILSGVILAAGVLYWLWSHIQLTQKKVQLLENAVFELRGMVGSSSSRDQGPDDSAPQGLAPVGQAEVYRDLEDDDWKDEEAQGPVVQAPMVQVPMVQVPVVQVQSQPPLSMSPMIIGREEPMSEPAAQFKELFVNAEDAKPAPNQTLEGLPLKELRRMATERGVPGVADMKKKEVIAALRNTVHPGLAPVEGTAASSSSDSVPEEKEIEVELASLDVAVP